MRRRASGSATPRTLPQPRDLQLRDRSFRRLRLPFECRHGTHAAEEQERHHGQARRLEARRPPQGHAPDAAPRVAAALPAHRRLDRALDEDGHAPCRPEVDRQLPWLLFPRLLRGAGEDGWSLPPARRHRDLRPVLSATRPLGAPRHGCRLRFVARRDDLRPLRDHEAALKRRDRLGRVRSISRDALWGAETDKAVANFPVSGEPIPAAVARWLGRIKAAAARVNAELGLLETEKAERIAAAADRVAGGELDDQFPIDVFQTGSGTSSNMNANEVIASLAGEDVHPNDDVNLGQSSNDVFPSAVHLAALDELVNDVLPALARLADSLQAKAAELDDVVKSGRTHLMDAVPVTLGQEFSGYAAQVRQGYERVGSTLERLGRIPLGGTAVGTGLNTHPEFAARVRARLAGETGLLISAPADPFEAQAARDALVEASGALKTVAVSLTKIANDLRLMASGPRAGLAEITLPELQKGSSIMPGKVNPVIPEVVTQVAAQVIGNDAAITVGGMQGHLELNVFVPMLARNLLHSTKLLASASRLLAERCVDGIEANRETCERYAELTLSAATALNPYIGYDRATEIVKAAARSGRPLREVAREAGVDDETLDRALDYRAMAKPHQNP
ncbi:MAG: class II fumarate hydratase [Actinobacteria bacterium]|nr:MAG: class II fumarate hydratase [Actinomycetota bacterium]